MAYMWYRNANSIFNCLEIKILSGGAFFYAEFSQWRILRYTAYTGGIPNFGRLKNIDEMCFLAKERIKVFKCFPNK